MQKSSQRLGGEGGGVESVSERRWDPTDCDAGIRLMTAFHKAASGEETARKELDLQN